MKDEDTAMDWGLLVLLLLGAVAAVLGGIVTGKHLMRLEAIKAGVAEWRVDPQTGAVRFEWKGQAK